MADTRRDKRAPVSLKVRFKSATVDEFIEHYSRDVSRGGIFIKSSQPMQIGTLLKFQFQLKDESELIRGVGRVVWVRASEDATAERPAGMGIKFIKMDGESRAMVDRIVESHIDEPGAYEDGAVAAGGSAPSIRPGADSERPSRQGEGFFPDLAPAQLPPPEDRTAVRQAAEFLGAALAGAASDEDFAREAELKAEEARRRTAEIEAQREAERAARRKQRPAEEEGLPSMIVDPSLGSTESQPPAPSSAPSNESPTQGAAPAAKRRTDPPPQATPVVAAAPASRPSGPSPAQADTSSPSRNVLLPVVALLAVIAIAGYMAMRGGPEPVPEVTATGIEQPGAAPPNPPPSGAAPAVIEPSAQVGLDAAEAEPEAGVAAERGAAADEGDDGAEEQAATADEATPVQVVIRTAPTFAELLVDGQPQPKARPVRLELPAGKPVELVARAPGWFEAREHIVPEAKMGPLKLTLQKMPWIVRVSTEPEGARVVAGGRRGSTPAELTLGAAPSGALPVSVKLPGYKLARKTVALSEFEETEQGMVVDVDFTLEELPTPARPPAPKPKPPASRPSPDAAAAPPDAPAAEKKPAQPAPEAQAPTPEPAAPGAPEAPPEPSAPEAPPEPDPADEE